MKLLRYGEPGKEQPGILDSENQIRSLSGVVDDISGANISPESLAKIAAVDVASLPVVDAGVRLGPCVTGTGKFVCIGLNYSDHAAESGMEVPAEPVIFMKATSSISGPNDDVLIPRGSEKSDWEVELGVVIGKHAKYVSESEALEHVAGYFVVNDLSERAYQVERCGQWVKGKSCSTMVFGVAHLVSYLSQFMSLHPGDIISTGTPPGVGLGQNPPTYLKPGMVMKLGIDGLGEQHQTTVADA